MGRGLSVRRRIQLVVVAFVVLIAVLVVAVVDTVGRRDAALAEAEQVIDPAREQTNRLSAGLVDQDTGVKAYLLTRDESFLESYERGGREVDQAGEALLRILVERPEILQEAEDVIDVTRAWRRAADIELSLGQQGHWETAASLVGTGQSRRLYESSRAEISDLRRALRSQQGRANEMTAAARERLTVLVYLTLGLALLLAVIALWLLGRWITVPLEAIGAAVRRVVEGELNHSIPAVGPSDMAELGRNVENMRAATVGLLERSDMAREALEQQGTAVMLLREELRPSGGALPANVAVASAIHAAEGILAGDWFDVIDRGDGHVVAFLVDVSGHGTQAGILALRTKHLLLAAIRQRLLPGETLQWLADNIGDTDERFLTCAILDVELETGVCHFANAGHPAPLLLVPGRDETTTTVTKLEPTGPLLGPLPARWTTERLWMPYRGLALMYTDGLIEARVGDAEFGMDRLMAIVEAEGLNGPTAAVDACVAAARDFAGGRFRDDVTVLALARTPATAASATSATSAAAKVVTTDSAR